MRGHWRGWTWGLMLTLTSAGLPAGSAAAQEAESGDSAEEAAEGAPDAEGEQAEEAPESGDGESEEERTERARALFAEGIDLVEQERWDEAASRFRATLEIKPAPAVRYNLASALYAAGQATEAEVLVDEVLDDPETDATIRGHAQELQSIMREETGQLRVEIAGDDTGVAVAVDGYELPTNRLGIDVAASPGTRVVTASRDGAQVAREEAEVTAGESTSVRLDVAPTPEAAAEAGLEAEETADEGDSGTTELLGDWRLWAAVGATVVVVAAAVILIAVTSGGTEDPVEGNFEPGVLRW